MSTAAPPAKKKRGTENVRDMVLSLIVVLAVVVPFYLLSGLADEEEGGIQVVDPVPQIGAFQQAVPGAPVPVGLPAQWRSNVADLEGPSLRIGWITPDDGYAEYAAQGGSATAQEDFLVAQTGEGRRVNELTVGDDVFQLWSNDEGATSLVLEDPDGAWTVVVGGVREEADDTALQTLAAALQ